jgi:hypothetical protein
MNMSKKFFIIGMRRSGTSILRDLISSHPDIQGIEFENHILRYALQCMEIPRYRNIDWAVKEIERFKNIHANSDRWYGIKYALNPGVFDMEWVYLYHHFPEAKFIFILRDKKQTYKSYEKLDRNIRRGHAPWDCYSPFFDLMVGQFVEYNKNNPGKSCIINYENLVLNADSEIKKAWDLLGLEPKIKCNNMMKIPENWENK